MDGIGKIEKSKEPVADKRVLGALEGTAGYALKANFSISTEELLGEDGKFQGLENVPQASRLLFQGLEVVEGDNR